MIISVIIPHHQESIEFMTPLLSSLDTQIGINYNEVEFIIVNDDKDHVIEDFSKFANIAPRVRQFFNEKQGYMGISRQIGIDNARGDYLLFFDADDLVYSCTILYDLMSRCIHKDADVYGYKFIEESRDENGNTFFVPHDFGWIWMFAKLYSREFIQRHNVRFSETLLWHEDTFFNQTLQAYNPRVQVLDYVGYVWRFNPASITRRNNAEYTSKSLSMYIDSIDQVIERTAPLVTGQTITEKKIWLIAYIYCCLQELTQIDIRNQARGSIEKRLGEFIKKYDPRLDCIRIEYARIVSETLHANQSVLVPNEGFEAFARRVLGQADLL